MSALLVGYARCSTDQQDLTAPRDGLPNLGVQTGRIYVDRGLTGADCERPGRREALPDARAIADELTSRQISPSLGGWAIPGEAYAAGTADARATADSEGFSRIAVPPGDDIVTASAGMYCRPSACIANEGAASISRWVRGPTPAKPETSWAPPGPRNDEARVDLRPTPLAQTYDWEGRTRIATSRCERIGTCFQGWMRGTVRACASHPALILTGLGSACARARRGG